MLNPKKLRILFIDDETLEIVSTLKSEGYDVDHWPDVQSLENIVDGRYHIVFFDVRGIGEKYGGNGLDIVKYVGTHNPLIHSVVFSAKPFNGAESELIRRYAKMSMTKDCSFYEIAEVIESYAKSITADYLVQEIGRTARLGFFQRFKLRQGTPLSPKAIEKIAKNSALGADAIKIVTNVTTVAASLIKLASGAAL